MKTFGLVSLLAQTRITLPLIHIETRFRVTGEFVAVEMDQVFEQTARESLDVTYTFPLPGDAAVYRCEMLVNGRLIRARVMEAEDARRTVAEKKAAGHRTALAEMDRENLFTLQLGNTAPGDRIIIRFAYFEKLERLGGSSLSLRIPFCPGLRYIPGKPLLRTNRGLGSVDDTDQVPDASRLSPPRIHGDHPDAATLYLYGTLDADEVSLSTLSSPSHPAIIRPAEKVLEVELAGEEHVPEQDFVLRWDETAPSVEAKPKAWITDHTDPADGIIYRHALLQLRAPFAEYTPAASDDFAQDIYFLLDRSGSMEGENWEQAIAALHAFVHQLGTRDRIWLTCFESRFQDFSDMPMTRDEMLTDTAFQNLASLGVGGGTELLPALLHVLKNRDLHSPNRPARLILITDGQVGNEDAILSLMRQQQGLPVHCFGIDTAVNDAFLKNLAQITGGRCTLMTPQDDIPAAIEKLAQTLRRPILTNLRMDGEGLTPRETPPMPDLCAGEVLLAPIRVRADLAQSLRLIGTLPNGSSHSITYDLGTVQPDAENPVPRLLWAHRQIRNLLDTERTAQAIPLAIAHNLACKGASFVAWDEAEKVPVAKREVYQPSLGIVRSPLLPVAARQPSFSGQVTDYSDEETLVTCSEEHGGDELDSMDILYEDSDDRYSLSCATSLQDASSLQFDFATTDPVLPRRVRQVFDTLRQAYGDLYATEAETTVRLAGWTHRFGRLLIAKLAIPDAVGYLIAGLLRAWAMETISTQRDQQLEAWLQDLALAPDFLTALRTELAAAYPSQALKDSTALLEAAIAHPVGEVRS
jgi:Ca-activated chloride channel family protein